MEDLGTVARGKSKHRPRNDPSLYGGPYPFIQTGDVKHSNFYVTKYTQTYNEKGLAQSKLWEPGTLCITIAANIADTAILVFSACFPDSIIGFIPNEKRSDVRFVKYCLESYKFQIQGISQGTTQDNLSLEKLRSINFRVPDLPTQRKIAAILTAYDDLIEVNKRRIALLEKMAEELYREWFVRMRFPGHQDTRFVKGVPEDWEISRVDSLGKVVTGKTPSTVVPRYYGDKYPFIKTPDMHGNMFVSETNEKLSEDGLLSQRSQTIPKNSLCVSCIGTGGVVSITTTTSQTNQQINTVCLYREEDLEWGYYVICGLKESIWLFGSTGTTMTNLSKGKFSGLKFLSPTIELRNKFHEIVKPIFLEINQLASMNRNLTKTRDLLLPRLISGKLSVENLDIQFPPSMHKDASATAVETEAGG
nr:restriction endonuclease subunit S [Pelovirga terrestris]